MSCAEYWEATGSGGLSFTGGGAFTNSGLLEALDGSTATVGSAVTVSNDAAGVLTGGRWEAAGEGSTLALAGGPAVVTDAAVVILSGAGSVFDTGGVALEQSLTDIAAKGKLELLAGRGWSGPDALSVDGQVQLAGGSFAPASLSVDSGGVVSGYGTISSAVADAGLVEASGGTLVVSGALSGSGVVEVAAHDTLELAQAAPAGLDVKFGGGIDEVLKLDDPAGFAATLDKLGLGDTLDLAGEDATSASLSGDTLAVTLSGGAVQDYALADPPSGLRLGLKSDGAGGTDLTLYKAAAASAALLQAAAAWTPHAPATALHPSAPAMDAAPMMAARHG